MRSQLQYNFLDVGDVSNSISLNIELFSRLDMGFQIGFLPQPCVVDIWVA